MTGIDGRVSGLNQTTYEALKKIQADGHRVDASDIHKLTEAMLKDGTIDAAELDLLNELANKTEDLTIHVEADFTPNTLEFGAKPRYGSAPKITDDSQAALKTLAEKAKTEEGQIEIMANKLPTAISSQREHYLSVLKEKAATHSSAVLSALSEVMDIGRSPRGTEALLTEILDAKGAQLNAQDYAALAKLLGNDDNYATHRRVVSLMESALKAGKPDAIAAVKQVAVEPGHYLATRTKAAELLYDNRVPLQGKEYAALIPLTGSGYRRERVEQQLLQQLDQGNTELRQALRDEAQYSEPDGDISWFTRQRSAELLAKMKHPQAEDYPAMVAALDTLNDRFKAELKEKLTAAAQGPQGAQVLDRLVEAIESTERGAPSSEARDVLLAVGKPHLRADDYKHLVRFLGQDNADGRRAEGLLSEQVQAGNQAVIDELKSEVDEFAIGDRDKLRSIKAKALLATAPAQLGTGQTDALAGGDIVQALSAIDEADIPAQKALVDKLVAGDETLKNQLMALIEARPRGSAYGVSPEKKAYRMALNLLTKAGMGDQLTEKAKNHLLSEFNKSNPPYEARMMPALLMQYAQAHPQSKTEILDALSQVLPERSSASSPFPSGRAEAALMAMKENPALLRSQDKQALAAAAHQLFEAHDYKLKENPETEPEILDALADIAEITDDAGLKEKLISTLPGSPVPQTDIDRATSRMQSDIQSMLSRAMNDKQDKSKLAQYARHLKALSIYNSEETPQAMKDKIDIDKIKSEIARLQSDPEVVAAFDKAKENAVNNHFFGYRGGEKPDYMDAPAEKLKTHLLSDAFHQKLRLMDDEAGKALVDSELQKLAFLDPEAAKEVMQELLLKQVESKQGEVLGGLSKAERKEALERVLGSFENMMTAADKQAKVADKVAHIIADMDKNELKRLSQNPEQMTRVLTSRLGNDSAAKSFVMKLHARGAMGSVMGLAGLVGMGAKWPPDNPEKTLGFMADGLSTAGSAADGAKLLRLASRSAIEGSRTFRFTTKVLGPIGDALSLGLNTYGAVRDFSDGDYVGGSAKAVGAASAGVGLGVALLSSNPAGWVVLACVGVGLLAWGADAAWGHDDSEAAFLRELGVMK